MADVIASLSGLSRYALMRGALKYNSPNMDDVILCNPLCNSC